MQVGILALQGDYEAHARAIESCNATPVEIRSAAQLDTIDGLIIPGGESTSMLKLMEYYELFEPLRRFGALKSVFGTCAGAILVATEVLNPAQASLGLVDLSIERNAYGRQLDSRVVRITGHALGGDAELEVVLIRAPIIRRYSGTVLASYLGSPILLEQGRHLVATFHPELTADQRVHQRFVSKLRGHETERTKVE